MTWISGTMACVLGQARSSESNLKDRGHIVDSKSVNGSVSRSARPAATTRPEGQPGENRALVTYGLLGVLLAGFLFSLIIRATTSIGRGSTAGSSAESSSSRAPCASRGASPEDREPRMATRPRSQPSHGVSAT